MKLHNYYFPLSKKKRIKEEERELNVSYSYFTRCGLWGDVETLIHTIYSHNTHGDCCQRNSRKSHLKFLRSGIMFPKTHIHTRFLNQEKFFREKSEIKDFLDEGEPKEMFFLVPLEHSNVEMWNKEQITTCVTLRNQESTYTYARAFLQMEKHLPFNFPFASHYFYLQIFKFFWGKSFQPSTTCSTEGEKLFLTRFTARLVL